jgi:hypothetical protein
MQHMEALPAESDSGPHRPTCGGQQGLRQTIAQHPAHPDQAPQKFRIPQQHRGPSQTLHSTNNLHSPGFTLWVLLEASQVIKREYQQAPPTHNPRNDPRTQKP